ncbi:hypothetical protein FNO01nite_18020 [Flavobacterium noncentrifugens]|uniref:Uncharacterized protein n=1 Tax=Flavobacterium noncentrifugens TaxID=1128970 RepID=A0A1G8Y909_9FLAO|nr:hypothetical protein [Flavobacterium noncentrifugens]GEP51130.1 hypothetical protein FNO01nite_18020 [Flavobacterium noncentrifugens]SDJ99163.1 hypothetical protein SAMN04487935_2233 [Flavobacterium noncentrifugens]
MNFSEVQIMENLDHILILKTDIRTEDQVTSLKPLLSDHPDVMDWSIDVDDVDCVLRVVSETLSCGQIVMLLGKSGYFCCELE